MTMNKQYPNVSYEHKWKNSIMENLKEMNGAKLNEKRRIKRIDDVDLLKALAEVENEFTLIM